MRLLVADRLTTLARARLEPGTGGQVHSTFAQALNLQLLGRPRSGGDDNRWHRSDRWVSLHVLPTAALLPSPFAIACPASIGPGSGPGVDLAPGVPVRVTADAVWLGGEVRVDLSGAAIVDLRLPAKAAPLTSMPRLVRTALSRTRGGLLPAVAGVLGIAPTPADPLARLAVPRLARLACATAHAEAAGCRNAAISLLGLGPGLTPAGDDVLVGWAAGLWVSGPRARRLVRRVRSGLLAAAAERTTALSRAFLTAALAGLVAEPLRGIICRPEPAAISALLEVGATSGADCLAGYLLARRARPLAARAPATAVARALDRGVAPAAGSA